MMVPSVINTNNYCRQQFPINSGHAKPLESPQSATNNSGLLINVTKSRLASLATTKTNSMLKSERNSENNTKKLFSHINNKLSLTSHYNKTMSSLMLDLGGKVRQLTNNLQKNHKRISESRLSLISDECYLAKLSSSSTTPASLATTASAVAFAAPEEEDRLSVGRQQEQHNTSKQAIASPAITMSPQKQKILCQQQQQQSDNNKLVIGHKLTTVYNDCQPLLKIAPKHKFQQQRHNHRHADNTNTLANLSGETVALKSKRGCCLSQVKYSIESLEYQRYLDNVQNSFLCRNFMTNNSMSLCQTMLWLVTVNVMILSLITGPGCFVLATDHAVAGDQLLLYSPAATINAVDASSHQQQSSGNPSQTDDYVDDGADIDVMAGQQQISTAHLLSAAGHIVPDNYFGPNSVPIDYSQSGQSQQQSSQATSPADPLQSASSERDIITVNSQTQQQQQQQHITTDGVASYIDYNGYNLATQPQHETINQADVVDFNGAHPNTAYYAIYNGENPVPQSLQVSLQSGHPQLSQDQSNQYNQMLSDNQIFGQSLDGSDQISSNGAGYNPSGSVGSASSNNAVYTSDSGNRQQQSSNQNNFGQPTRDGTRPKDLLSPDTAIPANTISSPVINSLANMPKVNMQQLASKVPQVATPQFSFSSSKDPMEKVKAVNQKKRTMMRQAEQLARLMIDSFNKKFGTTIGDQTDIPFVLSTLGPLGFAQNLLFDPSFLITLLHSTEKGYISDVLPSPAKMIIRPVLNAFRMPNKKRDKGNLVNVLSYISSGLQAPAGLQPNHRQAGYKKSSGTKKY